MLPVFPCREFNGRMDKDGLMGPEESDSASGPSPA